MIDEKQYNFSLPFAVLISFSQTLAIVLPSLFLSEHKPVFHQGMLFLLVYLSLTEIFMVLNRTYYANKEKLSFFYYLLRTIPAVFLIVWLTQHYPWQFTLVLVAYEFFILLSYLSYFDYLNSLLYSGLSAFFKGVVFNLIVLSQPPFSFKLSDLLPYFFSFLVFFLYSLANQFIYLSTGKGLKFIVSLCLALFGLFIFIFYVYQQTLINLLTLLVILSSLVLIILWFVFTVNYRKRELALSLYLIFAFVVFYWNFK